MAGSAITGNRRQQNCKGVFLSKNKSFAFNYRAYFLAFRDSAPSGILGLIRPVICFNLE
jgi:hypothetical protein